MTGPAKHTPGPWGVDANQFYPMTTCAHIVRNCKEGDNGVSESGLMVVGLGDVQNDEDKRDCRAPRLSIADACLIAAAPDLLAACKGILLGLGMGGGFLGPDSPECVAVRKAIARAEGRDS